MGFQKLFFFRLASNTGFDQFGALFGQVNIDDEMKSVYELNLPGIRQVREPTELKRDGDDFSLIGVCKDGFVLSLFGKVINGNIKYCKCDDKKFEFI